MRRACHRVLMAIAASWIDFNSWLFERMTDTSITVEGLPEIDLEKQCLVICNHQSWVDIPVLQKLFNRRLPLLRFFLKSQLIWVPLLGLAWWALDFPFMKRYTRAQIERRPSRAGRDIEATRRACAKFRQLPVSVVNFAEGTRFSSAKHAAQQSPYRYLLKPRAGGIGFVLDAMGDSLDTLIDVTIAYPDGAGKLTDLFANRIAGVRVHIETLPIPDELRVGAVSGDPDQRRRVEDWINARWQAKDRRLAKLLCSTSST